MKKSDVFTPQYPSPMDVHLYPTWKKFIALKQEIAKNWKEEMLTGMVGFRAYADLRDVRLSVKFLEEEKDPAVVISLRPVVGQDTIDELALYVLMFKAYKKLVKDITNQMYNVRVTQAYMETYPKYTKMEETRREVASIKTQIYIDINILRVLVMAINHDVLTRDHLDIIDKKDLVSLDAMVKGLGFGEYFGGGEFYLDVYEQLIGAFWKWSEASVKKIRMNGYANNR